MNFKSLSNAFSSSSSSGDKRSSEDNDCSEKFVDALEALLHPDAAEDSDGGLCCNDKKLVADTRKIVVDIAKQAGRKLLSGNLNLLSITFPTVMFEPRSYLQKLADPWVYPQYLDRAAATSNPVERLKLVTAWFVAGLHLIFAGWRKPFNPLLGETWQASLPDGTRIFIEQICHHPPVTAFEMIGPNGSYAFDGLSQPGASFKGNSVKTRAAGYRRVSFRDGSVITMQYPYYIIDGVLYPGEPTGRLKGEAVFSDAAAGLTCTVSFGGVDGSENPLLCRGDSFSAVISRSAAGGEGGAAGGGAGAGAGGSPPVKESKSSSSLMGSLRRSVAGAGSFQPAASLAKVVSQGAGNWLSHLNFDGQRYWTLAEDESTSWIPEPNPLPSDARFREDLIALAAADIKGSQDWKKRIEERQRAEAKLRPKHEKMDCTQALPAGRPLL